MDRKRNMKNFTELKSIENKSRRKTTKKMNSMCRRGAENDGSKRKEIGEDMQERRMKNT